MTIDREMISAARDAGACAEGLAWARERPRTIAELIERSREWAVWLATSVPLPVEAAEELAAAGCGRSWWRDGQLHRDDGPAVEYAAKIGQG